MVGALMGNLSPRIGALTTHRDRLPSTSQYELLVRLASGGMATVYVGRRSGVAGFSREVAIKRAHAHLLEDPAFAKMLVAEAKITSRLHHPNVVSVQAVEVLEGELLLVMDYIEGTSLAELLSLAAEHGSPLPAGVSTRILLDACAGLHAAHTALDERGAPLGIVHRDVSPQNILIGIDGVARVSDFGIAKSSNPEAHTKTSTGTLKGKLGYMAPEYVDTGTCDMRSDVYALGVVAWEAFTGRRLFRGSNEVDTLKQVLQGPVPKLSSISPALAPFDDVVMCALARVPGDRFDSAEALSNALETVARREEGLAKAGEVAASVRKLAGSILVQRRDLIRAASHTSSESSIRVVGRSDATGTMAVDLASADDAAAISSGGAAAATPPPWSPIEPIERTDAKTLEDPEDPEPIERTDAKTLEDPTPPVFDEHSFVAPVARVPRKPSAPVEEGPVVRGFAEPALTNTVDEIARFPSSKRRSWLWATIVLAPLIVMVSTVVIAKRSEPDAIVSVPGPTSSVPSAEPAPRTTPPEAASASPSSTPEPSPSTTTPSSPTKRIPATIGAGRKRPLVSPEPSDRAPPNPYPAASSPQRPL